MTTNIKIYSILFSLAFILLTLNLADAQTLVAGKIYNSDFSEMISDSTVTVTCNSNSLYTVSLNDGTYAIRYETSLCGLGDSVSVVSTKGELRSSDSGVIERCDGSECPDEYVVIINLGLKAPVQATTETHSHGHSFFYYCGNGKCDSGETVNTCPKDCKIIQTTPSNTNKTEVISVNTGSSDTAEPILNETSDTTIIDPKEQESKNDNLKKMTGAAIISSISPGSVIALILIIALIGLLVGLKVYRYKKNQVLTSQVLYQNSLQEN
jgi:hypothetical protein